MADSFQGGLPPYRRLLPSPALVWGQMEAAFSGTPPPTPGLSLPRAPHTGPGMPVWTHFLHSDLLGGTLPSDLRPCPLLAKPLISF